MHLLSLFPFHQPPSLGWNRADVGMMDRKRVALSQRASPICWMCHTEKRFLGKQLQSKGTIRQSYPVRGGQQQRVIIKEDASVCYFILYSLLCWLKKNLMDMDDIWCFWEIRWLRFLLKVRWEDECYSHAVLKEMIIFASAPGSSHWFTLTALYKQLSMRKKWSNDCHSILRKLWRTTPYFLCQMFWRCTWRMGRLNHLNLTATHPLR